VQAFVVAKQLTTAARHSIFGAVAVNRRRRRGALADRRSERLLAPQQATGSVAKLRLAAEAFAGSAMSPWST
jgi:hypothetical protein